MDYCISMNLVENYETILRLIEEKSAPVFEKYRSRLQCAKGCDSCCIDNFQIRYVESAYLMIGVQQVSQEVLAKILANLTSEDSEVRKKCPLLVDHACAAYAHRPVICRIWGIVVKHKERFVSCGLNFGEQSKEPKPDTVDYFDLNIFEDVLDSMSQLLWDMLPEEHRTNAQGLPEPPIKNSIRDLLNEVFKIKPSLSSP